MHNVKDEGPVKVELQGRPADREVEASKGGLVSDLRAVCAASQWQRKGGTALELGPEGRGVLT